ncbi:hypothetical protein RJ639_028208 [Escallonia herrerae]|uniref:Wound-responsive family protein n=1 Tax=Escallonia herrerae TaxID=1293975 RepID=A0AA88X5I2_9ASTE|nr:hypothetical protein RJ639_028208 [Escallonia herrerae]
MSSTSRAWVVAASIAAVEALKDQGFCRWNYALRSIQQHAKTNIKSYSQARRHCAPSTAVMAGEEKVTRSEESLRKVISAVNMSAAIAKKSALIVAASIGAVEALKDQGFCRWNYALRSMQQHAKTNLRSYYQQQGDRQRPINPLVSPPMRELRKVKQTEESLEKVMRLSCWGPSTVRF